MEGFHATYTKHLKSVRNCLNSAGVPLKTSPRARQLAQSTRTPAVNVTKCLKKPVSVCKSAPAVVYKFIRLRMHVVINLLPYFPNLKIIHLVRDPRGMFNSRKGVGFFAKRGNKTDEQNTINGFCQELQRDLSFSKLIQRFSANKLKVLRYEDLAEKPFQTVAELFSFTGLPFTKVVQNILKKKTSSRRDSCSYCTDRKNSTATASKWRYKLSHEHAHYIYKACKKSMRVLGYLPFKRQEDMRKVNIPSRIENNVSVSLANDVNF